MCHNVLMAPSNRQKIKIAERSLEEWKRIEGIGPYNRQRH